MFEMQANITVALILLSISAQLQAMWDIVSHTDINFGRQINVATIENEEGYKLEIYRDKKRCYTLKV